MPQLVPGLLLRNHFKGFEKTCGKNVKKVIDYKKVPRECFWGAIFKSGKNQG
ncbi:hypothetical protein [Rufibacter sp. LB8]|uniref:hypothetical protein n=1 Tax=Rufibacter sp. LB8 TaxID=2777781 RepID=UPI00178C28DF|nr:hypothetical protein [Rufibacter sp. LB8]